MKYICTIIFLLLVSGLAQASPFLVCDPYAPQTEVGLKVVSFTISGLSASPITIVALVASDGSQSLRYDLGLAGLVKGTRYTASVIATNGYGLSSPPSTVSFTLGVPAPPPNLRISL